MACSKENFSSHDSFPFPLAYSHCFGQKVRKLTGYTHQLKCTGGARSIDWRPHGQNLK